MKFRNTLSQVRKHRGIGKRSLLRKSQRRKPKRTSKNLKTITTSKMAFELITTTTSQRRKWLSS
jgi:hypothetical protein